MKHLVRLLLTLLLITAPAVAQELVVPEQVEGEAGLFVSIFVRARGGDGLHVEPGEHLQLIGKPELAEGSALVNLLVGPDAPAGTLPVTIELLSGDRVVAQEQVSVLVARHIGLELRVPEGSTAVEGDEVHYTLLVRNTGNSRDRIELDIRSGMPTRASATVLQLQPGATSEVELVVQTQGRSSRLTRIRATSGNDPDVYQDALIETTVLPFAGADQLDGPALFYDLGVDVGYDRDRFAYGALLGLQGELSDYVGLRSDLRFRGNRLSGGLSLDGEQWSVGYRGFGSLHRVEGSYGRLQGFVSMPATAANFTAGASYTFDPFRVSVSHSTDGRTAQAVDFAYRLNPAPGFSLTPSVGVTGRGTIGDEYNLNANLGLGAQVLTSGVSATGQFHMPLPADAGGGWGFRAAVSNRVPTPVGVTAQFAVTPRRLSAGLNTRQVASSQVTLFQQASYRLDFAGEGDLRVGAGANIRPSGQPLLLTGNVQSVLQRGEFGVGFGVGGSYGIGHWGLSASVDYFGGFGFGTGISYSRDAIGFLAAYRNGPTGDLVAVDFSASTSDFTGNIGAGYSISGREFEIEAGASYDITPNYRVFGSVGYGDEELQFAVGGNVRLRGGFATPEGVVGAFGGRAVGHIAGAVFHDLNRNGIWDPEEPPAVGIEVRAGEEATTTAEDGSFRLTVPPGSYTLRTGSTGGNLALRSTPVVDVGTSTTVEAQLPLETVGGITGLVFEDVDRDGVFDGIKEPLPLVRVLLSGGGESLATYTDGSGSFFFQGLIPGVYTLSLDASTLPAHYEQTTPNRVVEIEPGPFPREEIGAYARVRETVQTLGLESLMVTAAVQPTTAPPGADVLVTATSQGAKRVVAQLAGAEHELTANEQGQFEGYLTVPEDAAQLLFIEVTAEAGELEASQNLMLMVQEGSFASLRASPAFVDPEEPLIIHADLLIRLEAASVRLGDETIELSPDGPYSWLAPITAPQEPGTYRLELFSQDELLAETSFRVAE